MTKFNHQNTDHSNDGHNHNEHSCSASPLFGFYVFLGLITVIGGILLFLYP